MKDITNKIENIKLSVIALAKEGALDSAETYTFLRRLERLNQFVCNGASPIIINTEISLVIESIRSLDLSICCKEVPLAA